MSKIFVVDTIVTTRMRYFIECEDIEHAYDEITMKDSGFEDDNFQEVSQKFLAETIVDGREVTPTELDNLIELMSQDEDESCFVVDDLKSYIRKVNYHND